MPVRVANARESATLDHAEIERGTPPRALMRVAGANAAAVIAARCGDRLGQGVTVYTGPGNNGGDGWVVARSLAAAGVRTHVCEVVPASSPDAVAERAMALDSVTLGEPAAGGVVIDALLGTGATGRPRDALAGAVARIETRRRRGEYVVAMDVPTGVDATTGARDGSVVADLTIAFGTCKRGHLIARDVCGEVAVVDIGLGAAAGADLPLLIDAAWVAAHVPPIPFDAHKGRRKKLSIVAGGAGMGGSSILAAEGALRSGAGMVKVVTHTQNVAAIQSRLPAALTATLPLSDAALDEIVHWSDAMVLGPGLGNTEETRALVERVLRAWKGPVLLDADALNVFASDIAALVPLLRDRPAVLTPHVVEFARLIGSDAATVLARRFDIGGETARATGATLLLKGTPTVVTAPDGTRFVTATGTAALGTGGSGDVLSGIVATLLAQGCTPAVAAGCGAWVHGRAAELCDTAPPPDFVRGITLQDVLSHLSTVWQFLPPVPAYPILASLPTAA